MSSKQRSKTIQQTQPTFYLGDRYCTNMNKKKPYSFKHKMVVGPWKDRRALIECLFGYHNFCTYSSSSQDIVFDPKAQSRAFRAYIKGYYWKDFVDADGDVDKCTPLTDDTIVGVNQWIVVSSHLLPAWAPRYLPSKRYAFIKEKVPEKIGYSSTGYGGYGDARDDGKERTDYPRNRWEHEYWPKGMPHKVKWQRKHFSNFSEDDRALCQKFYSALPESKLQPGQPFTREFKGLFKKVKDREEKVVPAGIPKTLMAAMMDNEVRRKHEDDTRAAYEAACRPPSPRYPLAIRNLLIKSHGYTAEEVEEMERQETKALEEKMAKAKEEEAKTQQQNTSFASLFEVGSDEEMDIKPQVTKRKRVQEPPLVVSKDSTKPKVERSRDKKPKDTTKPKKEKSRKRANKAADSKPLRRSSRLRNRRT